MMIYLYLLSIHTILISVVSGDYTKNKRYFLSSLRVVLGIQCIQGNASLFCMINLKIPSNFYKRHPVKFLLRKPALLRDKRLYCKLFIRSFPWVVM